MRGTAQVHVGHSRFVAEDDCFPFVVLRVKTWCSFGVWFMVWGSRGGACGRSRFGTDGVWGYELGASGLELRLDVLLVFG